MSSSAGNSQVDAKNVRKGIMKGGIKEEFIHRQVVDYLRLQYPGVIFRTDYSAGIKLTPGMARKHHSLQEGRGYPDLFIALPNNKGYHGLFLELKRPGARVRKRDGSIVANEHIQEQDIYLKRLKSVGYKAAFAVGFDEAKKEIDDYIKHSTYKKRPGDLF